MRLNKPRQPRITRNLDCWRRRSRKTTTGMMGDHHKVARDKLPPELVKTLSAMQPGQMTDLIQIGSAYTIVRLNQHIPAGRIKFQDVQAQLMKQLQDKKTNDVRAAFDKKLRQNAKVEVL